MSRDLLMFVSGFVSAFGVIIFATAIAGWVLDTKERFDD